jgi:hypothetical protein
VNRVNSIMQGLVDQRARPANLLYLSRTPITPATNGEIMSREIRRIHIADVIAHDARATVYTRGKATFETYAIPKIKHGVQLTESEILQFVEMREDGSIPGGSQWADVENRAIDDLLTGIYQRMEQLIVAMHCDGMPSDYDRLGIKIPLGTWGMYSDLKVTPVIPWSSPLATPITDLWTIRRIMQVRYGTDFNRATMSTAVLLAMLQTNQFKDLAKTFIPAQLTFANLNTADVGTMTTLLERVIGNITIETYDQRYWSQTLDGGDYVSTPYLPLNKVILANSANDNRREVQDWANGIVIESMLAGQTPVSRTGRFGAPQRGPFAYATLPPELDPPMITYFGVSSGFPRKKQLGATAVLTVGTLAQFTDPIPVRDID